MPVEIEENAGAITCWEDAGSWESRSAIDFGSIYRRLEAIRLATMERLTLVQLGWLTGSGMNIPFQKWDARASKLAVIATHIG